MRLPAVPISNPFLCAILVYIFRIFISVNPACLVSFVRLRLFFLKDDPFGHVLATTVALILAAPPFAWLPHRDNASMSILSPSLLRWTIRPLDLRDGKLLSRRSIIAYSSRLSPNIGETTANRKNRFNGNARHGQPHRPCLANYVIYISRPSYTFYQLDVLTIALLHRKPLPFCRSRRDPMTRSNYANEMTLRTLFVMSSRSAAKLRILRQKVVTRLAAIRSLEHEPLARLGVGSEPKTAKSRFNRTNLEFCR